MQRSVEIRMGWGLASQSMMSSQIGNCPRAGADRVVETSLDADCAVRPGDSKGAAPSTPLQVHAPEYEHAFPRELGGLPLMGIGPLLVHEAVLGVVAEYLG